VNQILIDWIFLVIEDNEGKEGVDKEVAPAGQTDGAGAGASMSAFSSPRPSIRSRNNR